MEPFNDDDFNSSDIEFEQPVDPLAHLGQRSIQSMLDSAFDDRIESKKRAKSLSNTRGAPGTISVNATWIHRFEAFQASTLKTNTKIAPSGHHLERFFTSMPKHVRTCSPVGVPSMSWMKHAISSTIEGLIFKYPDFKLNKHERMRISTEVDRLEKEGQITKEPRRAVQWITACIITRICRSWLVDALENGTKSWEVTISRLLSIVLIAACGARSGEIGRSAKYTGNECICWKDVDIRFNSHNEMVCRITLRFEKKDRKKRTLTKRVVTLMPLEDPYNNAACPIKLLLVHGVRRGACLDGVDIPSILQLARAKGMVRWKPDVLELPVICAMMNHGMSLVYDKPAPALQLVSTVKRGGLLAGILKDIIPHDARRGSAHDFARSTNQVSGVATATVALQIGHSHLSRAAGITQSYVGPLQGDHWGPRVKASEPDVFGLPIANHPLVAKRLRTDDVVAECHRRNVDPKDHKARENVRTMMRKESVEQLLKTAEPMPASSWAPRVTGNRAEDLVELKGPGVKHSKRPREEASDEDAIDPRLLSEILSTATPQTDDAYLREDSRGEDDMEEVAGLQLSHFIEGDDASGFSDDCIAKLCFPPEASLHQIIVASGEEFMTYFSAINVVAAGRLGEEQTRFQYSCKNARTACPYQSRFPKDVRTHEAKCKMDGSRPEAPRPHKCQQCSSDFKHKDDLTAHIKRIHSWLPVKCPKCPHGPVYRIKRDLRKHHESTHAPSANFKPQKCNFHGCNSLHVFELERTFKTHLDGIHHLVGVALAEHIQRARQ